MLRTNSPGEARRTLEIESILKNFKLELPPLVLRYECTSVRRSVYSYTSFLLCNALYSTNSACHEPGQHIWPSQLVACYQIPPKLIMSL